MTLKKAIERVLRDCGGIATAEEISKRINSNRLFTKRDGSAIGPSYVLYGVKNYLTQFEVFIRQREQS
jgi:hypothetical protein